MAPNGTETAPLDQPGTIRLDFKATTSTVAPHVIKSQTSHINIYCINILDTSYIIMPIILGLIY